MTDRICIIPARSGSKRIKKKNIKNFNGKPLIWWTINSAIKSNLFSLIIVSSDDEELLKLAKDMNVIAFNRTEYFDDFSTSSEATIFTLKNSNLNLKNNTLVFQLLPTCPLRTGEDINEAYKKYKQKKLVSGVSCYKMNFGNPHWIIRKKANERIEFVFPDIQEKRSQDLDTLYLLSGCIWISQYKFLIKNNSFKGDNTGLLDLNWLCCLDIDTEEEFKITEKLASLIY